MRATRTRLAAALLGLAGTLVPTVTAAAAPTCADPAAPRTVEERRPTLSEPAEILRRSGFDRFGRVFTASRPWRCARTAARRGRPTTARCTGRGRS